MKSVVKKIFTIIQTFMIFGMIVFFIAVGFVGGVVKATWEEVKAIDLSQFDYSRTSTWKQHLEIYSPITTIRIGDRLDFLTNKLKRLEYEEITPDQISDITPKQFAPQIDDLQKNGKIDIYLHAFHFPRNDHPSRLIQITALNGKINSIRDKKTREDLDEFDLAPELIDKIYDKGGAAREIVSISEVPDILLKAFLATEDKRFYQHWGVDNRRFFGVVIYNVKAILTNRNLQGASTITMQITRNIYLSTRQLMMRKIKETLLAVRIELEYSKDEIMERYLNFINLGRYGSRDLLGVQEATKSYFGKTVSDLEIHECALLAAIPKSPPRYSPIRNPDRAKKRRDLVLRLMRNSEFITESQYLSAKAQPIKIATSETQSIHGSSHFLDHVHNELKSIPKLKDQLYNNGLKVYTTIDLAMQKTAENTVAEHLRKLDTEFEDLPDYDENKLSETPIDPIKSYLQAALLAIEPQTGHVKAMVGGRDYYITRQEVNFFNRAVLAKRQPGSAFKPIVLTALFNEPPLANPATIVRDEPWFTDGGRGKRWAPRNYRGRFYGDVTARKALEKSINVAMARLMNETPIETNRIAEGINRTIETAQKMGIGSDLKPYPALSLGASDLSLMEITSAYAVFANGGVATKPISILFVEDRNRDILIENPIQRRRALKENLAYVVTDLMRGVIRNGTGRRAIQMGLTRPAAGKTGTTNDFTDAWFVGFVPQMAVGVWVGFDEPQKSTEQEGAKAALPIWAKFMIEALRTEPKKFPRPNGVTFREIDRETGMLRSPNCPKNLIIREVFLAGHEPNVICNAHE